MIYIGRINIKNPMGKGTGNNKHKVYQKRNDKYGKKGYGFFSVKAHFVTAINKPYQANEWIEYIVNNGTDVVYKKGSGK